MAGEALLVGLCQFVGTLFGSLPYRCRIGLVRKFATVCEGRGVCLDDSDKMPTDSALATTLPIQFNYGKSSSLSLPPSLSRLLFWAPPAEERRKGGLR